MALPIALAALLVAYLLLDKVRGLGHHSVPRDIIIDQLSIERGVVPRHLTWAIPQEYLKSENKSVTSRVEPTFVTETRRPMWSLIISLKDPDMTDEIAVLYDLQGQIYEY